MIENLNTLSFNNYGKVVHEGFQYACNLINCQMLCTQIIDIASQALDKLISIKNSPTILDIADGIALLYVSSKPSESMFETFLLDKTVYINPGVYYGIIPLYGKCTIKRAYNNNSELDNFLFIKNYNVPGFSPKVTINKVLTLFYQEKERGFIFKGEKHDFWELTYVDKEELYTIVDEKGYRLKQGEALFYAPDQHHVQWSDMNCSTCFITITFDMDFEESSYLIDKKFKIDFEMAELIKKIIQEKESSSYYSDDLIICYLKELIIKLVRNDKLENTIHRQNSHIKNKIENSIVSQCIDFIHKNISSKISVIDIARSIPISQSYLSSIFKKHMNMTLVDYINNYRLEKSKDFIRSSEYNLTQIAEKLGYSTVHYFSNQFKAKYGVSPSTYAKSIK